MNSFDLFGNPTQESAHARNDKGEELSYSQGMEAIGDEISDGTTPKRPLTGIVIALIVAVGVLAAQAYRLQVSNASVNRALAEGNSVRLLTVSADRGLIVDANGTTLAQNTRKLALGINPQTLPVKKSNREFVYATLQAKAGLSNADIAAIEDFRNKSPEVFAIKTNLTKDESPGVVLQELPIRNYTDGASLGQILGYVGRPDQTAVDAGDAPNSQIGRAGIEKQYETILEGQVGVQHAEVNAAGEVVRLVPDPANAEPKTGQTLKLSIDSKLQEVVATALKNELDRRTAKLGPMPKLGASAVVINPTTGAIKAMVSLPDYKASLFADGISGADYQKLLDDPGSPLLNRAIQGAYAPGSTIKPLVASVGLENGVITANTQMNTPAAITIGASVFPDWKTHGQTNTRKAIAESNNIFFYAVGGGWSERNFIGLGIDRLSAGLESFGLGAKTGIDIPGEVSGLIPTPEWKLATQKEKWFIGDTYHSSIGQGYDLTTPLQMALSVSAIANGGTLWKPSIAWSTVNPITGVETELPHSAIASNFISSDNLQTVREGMRETVLSGSGRPLNQLQVTSAGKTGTAQVGTQGQLNAWYTGFAPYDHPTLAFAILIEGGGESFYSSVPVAEEILRGAFNEPLQPGQKLFANTDVPADYAGER
jgi:penicillin-binding protein 2